MMRMESISDTVMKAACLTSDDYRPHEDPGASDLKLQLCHCSFFFSLQKEFCSASFPASETVQLFWLEVSLKIEVYHQPVPCEEYCLLHITVAMTELMVVHWFTYTFNVNKLKKITIYRAIVLATLL